MNVHPLIRIGLFVSLTCLLASGMQAQATRTWVSGVGDDANPCSRTAPCKTFAGAISKTAAGGEIDALDPAGFGGLTITKAITIDGGGGQVASSLVSGTNAFSISAGANDRVVIRNVRFVGLDTGLSGINFASGLSLAVDHCVIQQFNTAGINFHPPNQASLTVSNSELTDVGATGIISTSPSGVNRVTIVNSTVTNSTIGVKAGINSEVTIKGSVISNNSGGGVVADGNSLALLTLNNTLVTNNDGFGVRATNNGIVLATNSTIIFNSGNGLTFDPGAQIISFGQNSVIGNSGAQAFSSNAPLK